MEVRQSNIEALRIVAMLLVLQVHCTFFANGAPTYDEIHVDPLGSGYFSLVEALALVCVDCYVLISGYFGIRPSWRGLSKLLFIVYFWRYSLMFANHYLFGGYISGLELFLALNPFNGDWFVASYLGLYAISPVLNVFTERSTKREFAVGLMIYLFLMLFLGWIMPVKLSPFYDFRNGLSAPSFIGLYLIGAWVRRYLDASKYSIRQCILAYIMCAVVNALIFIGLIFAMPPRVYDLLLKWFWSYDNLFTILASVALLVAFSKLKFKSKFVNWIAASSFSIYLIHINPAVLHWFMDGAVWLKATFWPWLWLPSVLVYISGCYLLFTFVDQLRVICWMLSCRLFNKCVT